MTKKVEKKIEKCIEGVADMCAFLLTKFSEEGYFKDPSAALEKLTKTVAELSAIGGTGASGEGQTGVVLLPMVKNEGKEGL